MQQDKKLRCNLSGPDQTGRYTAIAEMFDGTAFTVKVPFTDCEFTDSLPTNGQPTVNGWLFVIQEARQDDRVSITLPAASDQFGRNVTVNNLSLMPRIASVDMFHPQNPV